MSGGSPGQLNDLPGPVRRWVLGARPRTLWSAVAPVAVGTAVGWWVGAAPAPVATLTGDGVTAAIAVIRHEFSWARALLALVVALGVQIGTNYANDYSDGVRGTDKVRVGPVRLVASGLATPGQVRTAALLSFAVAAGAGIALAALTTWWLVLVGACCFAAGWLYTGGPKPYGYLGLGELFVFVFFGLVATVGSAYVQCVRLAPVQFAAALPVGFVAVALLEANNLRDVEGDAASGKRTLAVRLGRPRAGWLYIGSLIGVAAGVVVLAFWRPWTLLALASAALAVEPVRTVRRGAQGRELLPVLGATGRIQLVLAVFLTAGILA